MLLSDEQLANTIGGYLSKVTYVLAAEAHTLKMCRIKNNIWYQKHEIFKFYLSRFELMTN